MRKLQVLTIAMLGFSVAAAHAQPVPASPARPGHVPGIGQSLPLSNNASNINAADSKQGDAPTLPGPGLGNDARPEAYLQAAHDALAGGRTGQAQQALEMAETRLLDRSVVADKANDPSQGRRVSQITAAREALGRGDKSSAMSMIDAALVR
jgi:hypothetical protein